MSIEQIVSEAAAMTAEQRRELIERLLAIGRERREQAKRLRKMDEMIDDNDPAHWISYDELKRRLPADAPGE